MYITQIIEFSLSKTTQVDLLQLVNMAKVMQKNMLSTNTQLFASNKTSTKSFNPSFGISQISSVELQQNTIPIQMKLTQNLPKNV